MFERQQTITEYSRHLPNSMDFTLGEAFAALKLFYSVECNGCNDDGLVFLSGAFADESSNFQIVLCRFYDMFSQLTVTIQYSSGIRTWLAPAINIVATERMESSEFFADVTVTRVFWMFKNVKPVTCSIKYQDADDRGDDFYAGVAKLGSLM